MRLTVGQIAQGPNFYPRQALLRQLYRQLESGVDFYLAAPRRMGKSSLMHHLLDRKDDQYAVVYITTEDVDNTEGFFRELLRALKQDIAADNLLQRSLKSLWDRLSAKISIEVAGVKAEGGLAENKQNGEATFYEAFKDLLRQLTQKDQRIVLMIDEFPQAAKNIQKKAGEAEAVRFLACNRTIRQSAGAGISFILTGSIGLNALAEQLDASQTINDLATLEVGPLSKSEAKELIERLLKNYGVYHKATALAHLFERVQWFSPFFIQLLCQEFINECEGNTNTVDEAMVDRAIEHITRRNNDQYFMHYHQRLSKAYLPNEVAFAQALLARLAGVPELPSPEVAQLARDHDLAAKYALVLRSLEADGYLLPVNDKTAYRFTSPILQLWWKKCF
jgi:uncharacterized protein